MTKYMRYHHLYTGMVKEIREGDRNERSEEDDGEIGEFETLRNKGALFVLMTIARSDDGLRFSEIRDQSGLATGTVHRRLEELRQTNWIKKEPMLDKNGNTVTKYYLTDEASELQSAIEDLASAILE